MVVRAQFGLPKKARIASRYASASTAIPDAQHRKLPANRRHEDRLGGALACGFGPTLLGSTQRQPGARLLTTRA